MGFAPFTSAPQGKPKTAPAAPSKPAKKKKPAPKPKPKGPMAPPMGGMGVGPVAPPMPMPMR